MELNVIQYMLIPVQEQKMELAVYAAVNSDAQQLLSHQLDIMKRVISHRRDH